MISIARLVFRDALRSVRQHSLVLFLIFIVLTISIFVNIAHSSANEREAVKNATFGEAEYVVPFSTYYFDNLFIEEGYYDEIAAEPVVQAPPLTSTIDESETITEDETENNLETSTETWDEIEEVILDTDDLAMGSYEYWESERRNNILKAVELSGADYKLRQISSISNRRYNFEIDSLDLEKALASGQVNSLIGEKPEENEVVLSSQAAKELGLEIGDKFGETSSEDVKVVGIVDTKFDHNKIFIQPSSEFIEPVDFNSNTDKSYIEIKEKDVTKVKRSLDSIDKGLSEYVLNTKEYVTYSYGPGIRSISTVFIILVSLISIISFIISTKRREEEYYRLNTIGAKPSQISLVVVFEALLISLIAAIAAGITAVTFTIFFKNIFSWTGSTFLDGPIAPDTAVYKVQDFLIPILVSTFCAGLAAWYPSHKVAQRAVSPVAKANNKESESGKKSIIVGAVILLVVAFIAGPFFLFTGGSVLLIPALLFGASLFGVGILSMLKPLFNRLPITSRYVTTSALRNRIRMALTISPLILVIAIGLVIIQLNLGNSRSYDFYIEPGQKSILETLPSKGQFAVKSLKNQTTEFSNGWNIDLNGIDSELEEMNKITIKAVEKFDQDRNQIDVIIANKDLIDFFGTSSTSEALEKPNSLIADSSYYEGGKEFIDLRNEEFAEYTKVADEEFDYFVSQIVPSGGPWVLVSEANASQITGNQVDYLEIVTLQDDLTRESANQLQSQGFYMPFDGSLFDQPSSAWQEQLLWTLLIVLISVLIMRAITVFLSVESNNEIEILSSVGAPPKFRRTFLSTQAFFHLGAALLLAYIFCVAGMTFLISVDYFYSDGYSAIGEFRGIKDYFQRIVWIPIFVLFVTPFVGALLTMATTKGSAPAVSRRTGS